VESWALLIALPVLQWISDRRAPITTVAILLLPPIAWLGIGYAATADPLAYFADRARYHAEYIGFHPERHGFQWSVVAADADYFFLGAGKMISLGALATGIILLVRSIRFRKSPEHSLLAPLIYATAMLGLLVLAYLMKSQPVLLPRYGLAFLAINLPLFGWVLQFVLAQIRTRARQIVILICVMAGCVIEMQKQLPTVWKVRDDFAAHQRIATALVTDMKQSSRALRCFSDDVAVRVLSGLPRERFLRTGIIPTSATATADDFLHYLRNENVGYLIFFRTEDSIPVKFFPDLDRTPYQIQSGTFELINFAASTFGPDVWLYRIR
jgi:hypothetical protein